MSALSCLGPVHMNATWSPSGEIDGYRSMPGVVVSVTARSGSLVPGVRHVRQATIDAATRTANNETAFQRRDAHRLLLPARFRSTSTEARRATAAGGVPA